MAVLLLPMLIWMAITLQQGKSVVSEPVTAVVSSIVQTGKTGNEDIYTASLKLPDGQSITLLMRPPVPQAGESIPLTRHVYADQKQEYRFNREAWQLGH